MIDYLISNPKKINRINLELYCESYDFFSFLGIFYEFIWIYFELKRIKNQMWQLVYCGRKRHHHVVAYKHATWFMHMWVRMRARVCACARACVAHASD